MKDKDRAMIDMAAGFGRGSRYPWDAGAAKVGETFLKARLNAGKHEYWKDPKVRKEALAKARVVAELASVYAENDPNNPRPIQIMDTHLDSAIKDQWIRQGDCPFD